MAIALYTGKHVMPLKTPEMMNAHAFWHFFNIKDQRLITKMQKNIRKSIGNWPCYQIANQKFAKMAFPESTRFLHIIPDISGSVWFGHTKLATLLPNNKLKSLTRRIVEKWPHSIRKTWLFPRKPWIFDDFQWKGMYYLDLWANKSS